MDNLTQSIRNQRRPKGIVTSISINYIHLRNPYVIAMWSAFFPGFGHISLGSYIQGFILFLWEMLVNINAHVNIAIFYSFQGKFELAKNAIDKRNPWFTTLISIFMPGSGHLTTNRLPTGFFVLGWLIAIAYYSHLNESLYFTFIGDFTQAKTIVNPEWLLFLPSIFGFAFYDAYVNAVEHNKLFDIEQSRFLKDNYQSSSFNMPI